jgi:hypothetical protein
MATGSATDETWQAERASGESDSHRLEPEVLPDAA